MSKQYRKVELAMQHLASDQGVDTYPHSLEDLKTKFKIDLDRLERGLGAVSGSKLETLVIGEQDEQVAIWVKLKDGKFINDCLETMFEACGC